jgi:hypothetical protein
MGKADRFLAQVRQMDEVIDRKVDNASKEQILVGRVMSIVGEAGQIYRARWCTIAESMAKSNSRTMKPKLLANEYMFNLNLAPLIYASKETASERFRFPKHDISPIGNHKSIRST